MRHFMIRLKGSFTVEISLIMPLLLAVIVMIMYLGMYIYDASIAEYSAVATILHRGCDLSVMEITQDAYNSENYRDEMLSVCQSYLDDTLKEYRKDVDIKESGEVINLDINLTMNSENTIAGILSFNRFGYSTRYRVNNISEYQYMIENCR